MNAMQILLFAVVQGITELFPVSSLGHGVLIPAILGWSLNRTNPDFLPFLVVLHLGTATALLLYFRRDWRDLLAGAMKSGKPSMNPHARIFWLLVVATIPAGLLGLLLEKKLRLLFGSVGVVSVFLILNGIVLLIGDTLKHRKASQQLEGMRWTTAFAIGAAQALALVPGMSRSGVTLVTGLAAGLDYAASARFSFLLATPIIGAAGLLEVPKLFNPNVHMNLSLVLLAGVVAGGFAYLSTWILMRYFSGHEVKALRPFGFYCMIFGAGALIWSRF